MSTTKTVDNYCPGHCKSIWGKQGKHRERECMEIRTNNLHETRAAASGTSTLAAVADSRTGPVPSFLCPRVAKERRFSSADLDARDRRLGRLAPGIGAREDLARDHSNAQWRDPPPDSLRPKLSREGSLLHSHKDESGAELVRESAETTSTSTTSSTAAVSLRTESQGTSSRVSGRRPAARPARASRLVM